MDSSFLRLQLWPWHALRQQVFYLFIFFNLLNLPFLLYSSSENGFLSLSPSETEVSFNLCEILWSLTRFMLPFLNLSNYSSSYST